MSRRHCTKVAGRSTVRALLAGVLALTLSMSLSVSSQARTTLPAARQVSIPILMYHYIRVNPVASDRLGASLSVTPNNFAAQMSWLRQNGATSITFDELDAALRLGQVLPAHPVILTFDDGYADFATTATPILRANGFRGIDYVVPGFLDRPNYMTTGQLREVAAAGMVLGAHTMHHVALPKVSAALAATEIAQSRAVLQQLTGQPVNDFAYPYGMSNARVAQQVANAGFREAVTTVPGFHEQASQRFAMPRVRVRGGESLSAFASSLLPAWGTMQFKSASRAPSVAGLAPRNVRPNTRPNRRY